MKRAARPLLFAVWAVGIFAIAVEVANQIALFAFPDTQLAHLGTAVKLFGFDGPVNAFAACASIAITIWLATVRPGLMTFCLFLAVLDQADSFIPDWPIPRGLSDSILFASRVITHNGLWAALVVFAVRFPEDVAEGWRKTVQAAGFVTLFCSEAFLIASEALDFPNHLTGGFAGEGAFNSFASASIFVAALLLTVRYFATEGRVRLQIRWAIIGCIAGFAGATVTVAIIATSAPGLGTWSSFGVWAAPAAFSMALIPAFSAYTLTRTHFIHPAFILNRATVFTVTVFLLAVCIGALDWVIAQYLAESRLALTLQAIVTVGFGFALNHFHRRVESAVELLFFRRRYEAIRFLRRLGRSLSLASHQHVIEEALAAEAPRALGLASGALFRRSPAGTFTRCSGLEWDEAHVSELTADDQLVRFLRESGEPKRVTEVRWGGSSQDLCCTALIRTIAKSTRWRNKNSWI